MDNTKGRVRFHLKHPIPLYYKSSISKKQKQNVWEETD